MQAYNYSDLKNQVIRKQSSEAFLDKTISADSYKNILGNYPSKLFTPNYFIRIALGLLTIVAVSFSSMLLALFFSTSSNEGAMFLCIFLAGLTYIALEGMVKRKHFYNAGVDNILMCSTLIFLVSTVVVIELPNASIIASFITMLFSFWLCIRFTDAFMACVSYLSAFVFIFLLFLKLGAVAWLTAPFVMMIFSGGSYLFMNILLQRKNTWLYHFSCRAVILLTLITFYAAGNSLVRDLTIGILDLPLAPKNAFSLSWVFWILTFAIPILYLGYGILKRNLVFIRTGIALTAVSILTFRYYFAILPGEVVLLIAGIILASGSYLLTRYLRLSKYGFSFDHTSRPPKELLNAQAIILTQAFGKKEATHTKSVEFGGGSFGGGGAGSNY